MILNDRTEEEKIKSSLPFFKAGFKHMFVIEITS